MQRARAPSYHERPLAIRRQQERTPPLCRRQRRRHVILVVLAVEITPTNPSDPAAEAAVGRRGCAAEVQAPVPTTASAASAAAAVSGRASLARCCSRPRPRPLQLICPRRQRFPKKAVLEARHCVSGESAAGQKYYLVSKALPPFWVFRVKE